MASLSRSRYQVHSRNSMFVTFHGAASKLPGCNSHLGPAEIIPRRIGSFNQGGPHTSFQGFWSQSKITDAVLPRQKGQHMPGPWSRSRTGDSGNGERELREVVVSHGNSCNLPNPSSWGFNRRSWFGKVASLIATGRRSFKVLQRHWLTSMKSDSQPWLQLSDSEHEHLRYCAPLRSQKVPVLSEMNLVLRLRT